MSTVAVKERPILFSGPMVKAILDGRKTQTRRIVKPQPNWIRPCVGKDGVAHGYCGSGEAKCPYGQPGDQLWVKETWQTWAELNKISPANMLEAQGGVSYPDVNYLADGNKWDAKVRVSIHMPRWASRITLEIKSVRVERLQEISHEDSLAEGIKCTEFAKKQLDLREQRLTVAQLAYSYLWESINGPESWAANPWVWCVEFARI